MSDVGHVEDSMGRMCSAQKNQHQHACDIHLVSPFLNRMIHVSLTLMSFVDSSTAHGSLRGSNWLLRSNIGHSWDAI